MLRRLIQMASGLARKSGPGEKAARPRRTGVNGDRTLLSERLQIERKQFFLDLKENASGRFLRITEDVGGHRDKIIVPATGLAVFSKCIERMIVGNEDS